MTPINGQRLIVGTFFLACAIIAWNNMKNHGVAPAPYRFIGAGVVYGVLATISPFVGPAAAVAGVGYVIVLMYQFFGANLATEGATSVGGASGGAVPLGGSIVGTAVSGATSNGSPNK